MQKITSTHILKYMIFIHSFILYVSFFLLHKAYKCNKCILKNEKRSITFTSIEQCGSDNEVKLTQLSKKEIEYLNNPTSI